MKNRSKLLLGLLGAAIVLAAAVSSASANRLAISVSSQRAVWRSMNFTGTFGVTVSCPVTLEGTLHSRTISKISGLLIGYITTARVGEASCTGGTARALTETLPWHVQFVSFTGTLPNITGFGTNVTRASFQVSASVLGSTVTCLYITSQTEPTIGTYTRNILTTVLGEVRVSGRIRKNSGSGVCGDGNLSGTSVSLTELGETRAISVTLVA
jgi:hypothetical protein